MKTKETKRQEAQQRAQNYTYERSKAYRKGTATREQWEAQREKATTRGDA